MDLARSSYYGTLGVKNNRIDSPTKPISLYRIIDPNLGLGFTESINLKMAMKQVFNEIKGMKVKDVPAHVKPWFTVSNMKTSILRSLDNYHAKYIQTDSIQPLYHVCFGGMIFSYLVALPEERRHLEHQQHIKEHGGH